VIIRIQGEGQYRLDDAGIDEINRLDDNLEAALNGTDAQFREALQAIESRVREVGSPLADDDLAASDVVLPPSDATKDEVAAMLGDDGLVPG